MDARAWDAFCDAARNGTVFHTRAFLDYHPPGRFAWDHAALMSDGGEPLALFPAAAVDEDGIRTWWSGAGASFGGPVLREGAGPDEAAAAVERIVAEARARGYRRIRTTPPPPVYEADGEGVAREALRAAGFRVVRSEITQAAPLAGRSPDDLLDGPARRGARKAERERVMVREETAYAEFHELLVEDRRAMDAAPVHSREELEDLARRLGSRQVLLLARRDGEPIAGTWLLAAGRRVAMSFYVCQVRAQRRLRATNLLTLHALRWSAARSLHQLDYGTSSIDGRLNEGLFAFKEAHGGRPGRRETYEIEVP
jgi:hypothetical protein